MNRFVPFLMLVAALNGFAIAAPTSTPATATTTNEPPARWLLVVNTSAAMERRARAVEGMVGELLATGMRGELQPRDQVGLWLFNRELQTGAAPLQTWLPAQSNLIAGRTVGVLALQKFTGAARFTPVLEEVQSLIAESHRLTVLFFTDTSATFTNTPWDAELNAAVAAEKAALEKTRMPLVIALRGYQGKLIGQSVTLAPWPVEFPPFPVEPVVVAKVEPPPAPARPAGPPREIYIGPRPAPEAAPVVVPVAVGESVASAARPEPLPATAAVEPLHVADATPTLPTGLAEKTETAPAVVDKGTHSITPITNLPVSAARAPLPPTEPPVATPANPAPAATKPVVASVPAPVPPRATGTNWLLIGGVGLLSVASGLAVFLALRSRRPAPTSFITRSMVRR